MGDTNLKIVRTEQCYYSLYINGTFEGNYDTHSEAARAADEALAGVIKDRGDTE